MTVQRVPREGEIPVVVTTSHRGVFFGYVTDATLRDVMTLRDARMCVYWPQTVKGVLGLAAVGPLKGSKVGPAVPELSVSNCDALMLMTDEAVAAWEKAPWSN